MARPILIEFANAFYHVMSRGLNKQDLFLDDGDNIFFLFLLNQAKEKFSFITHSYCLMTNHYHLFIQTPKPNLSKIMKFINENYARYFLRKYVDKDGHVFKGRYKRKIVQSDLYSLQLSRYIHLNPVKAGLVEHPHQWKWSSYKAFVGLQPKNKFLNIEWLSSQFSENKDRRKEFITQYTYQDIDCNWDPEDYTQGKIVLGSKDFFNYIVKNFVKEEDLSLDILAATELNISKNYNPDYVINLINRTEVDNALKEKLLIYYLKEHTLLSLKEIGCFINKNPKTVSKTYNRAKFSLCSELKSLIK
jgi:REP element-mobilizing transposase RayT